MSVHIPVRDGIPLFDLDECTEPLSEWQDAHYPNCNAFHSIDITNDEEMKLLGLGGHRMVWNHKDQAVLKVMRWKDSFFEPRQNEHVRIDAIVSERLTSSPHVMNVYGICGLSLLNEMGRPERHWQRKVHPERRLHMAQQLANAVADLHDIDGTNVTTAVWRNLKPENILFVGDKLKINDFDDSILIRRNSKDGSACKFQLPSAPCRNKTFQPPELCYSGRDLDETIDIF
jgi:serine/threonine protein kinase